MYLFFLQDYFLEIKKQNLEDFDTWSILQKKKKKLWYLFTMKIYYWPLEDRSTVFLRDKIH